jgi:predicted DNA-binding transcriptional regulator AlpA
MARPEVTGKSSANPNKLAFSIAEFCELHDISRAHFYNFIKTGGGPRMMDVGGRKIISREAAEAWRREREAASAAPQSITA